MSSAPSVKWTFSDTLSLAVDHFSAIADLDGDGLNEVVVGNYGGGYDVYTVYCFDGRDGSVKWRFVESTNWIYAVSAADVDGDGAPEVLVSSDNGVYCLEGDGSLKWRAYFGGAVFGAPAVGDPDGDGATEVVFATTATSSPVVVCVSGADGSEEWRRFWGVLSESSPVICDLDGDGLDEVLIGASDGSLRCLRGSDGLAEWTFPTDTTLFNNSPTVADVDGDGALEVLITDKKSQLYCVSGSGSLEWRFDANNDPSWSGARIQPALANVDADPALEIFLSSDTLVYCLDGASGSVQWEVKAGGGSLVLDRPVSLADYDGDNRLEVLVAGVAYYQKDSLILLNAEDGSRVWSLWIGERIQKPFPGDVDGDGCLEIVAATIEDNSIRVLDDLGDQDGCGVLYQNSEENAGGFKSSLEQVGASLVVKVASPGQYNLSLYDPAGRLEKVLFRGFLPPGEYRFPVPKGVHVARLGPLGAVVAR